ncbi:polymorphic toxin type 44 domain-containing protein [Paenibacillus thiaminolyticus]|uniref:polymorphic toxin type 44 domain-containing protein n=1 Tax=Paenibacillus thiaminolyticus TaxID=49283 RepID=UPI00232FA96E|nr:polymorphic toxin type 44 domain-containing protein [Paenibacillus thiaminolyticus]WCF10252.1 polymorphic toxin type 44 domain-containing protein [Paenibacillus thiaminolyticus]
MINSKCIKIILVSSLFSSSLFFALPANADYGCNSTGGGIGMSCTEVAPDITASFTSILRENAKLARDEYRKSITMGFGSLTYMYGWWYNKVRWGGPWDYKLTYVSHIKYTFRGKIVTGEYLGNLHYGYVGKAARFSETELLAGGGFAAYVAGTHEWSNISGYFDGIEDTKAIKDGFELYDSGY